MKPPGDTRAERLAQALRANLRRRKAPATPAAGEEGDGSDGVLAPDEAPAPPPRPPRA